MLKVELLTMIKYASKELFIQTLINTSLGHINRPSYRRY